MDSQSDANGVRSALIERIRDALETADLDSVSELLDPDVHWGGPSRGSMDCVNKQQVIAWWQRGRASGRRANVTEILTHGDRVVIGLRVAESPAATESETNDRWQVLTLRNGLVVDIRGVDDRALALEIAGVSETAGGET